LPCFVSTANEMFSQPNLQFVSFEVSSEFDFEFEIAGSEDKVTGCFSMSLSILPDDSSKRRLRDGFEDGREKVAERVGSLAFLFFKLVA
jgi:hypothetical protein